MDIPETRAHNQAVRENKQSTHTAPIHNTQKKLPFIYFLYVIKTTWTDKKRESACRRRGLYFDKLLRNDKFPKKLETSAEKQHNQHFPSFLIQKLQSSGQSDHESQIHLSVCAPTRVTVFPSRGPAQTGSPYLAREMWWSHESIKREKKLYYHSY